MTKKREYQAGFTLIELLAVIAIIAILAGIVVQVARVAVQKAAIARAEGAMKRVQLGLEEYKAEYGLYPPTKDSEELIDLIYYEPINEGKQVFVEFQKGELTGTGTEPNEWIDPWGNFFLYNADPNSSTRRNPDTYDLWSFGPDGKEDTEDDLNNW